MRGFLDFYHYGHACFIREEYEAAHRGEDELQRIEDALNMTFSDVNTALYYALSHARYLLYRCESDDIDNDLLRGRDPWVSFKGGYVHIVTGEYVLSSVKPTRDSYPCWKLEEPAGSYFGSNNLLTSFLIAGAILFLNALLGGRK